MDVRGEMVQVTTRDGKMRAYTAAPAAGGTYPGVVVVMEAFGLNDHIQDVARRIAAEGYVTLAPDLYYRQGGPVVPYSNLQEAIRLMNELWDEQIIRDMGAAIGFLQADQRVQADRIGVTGFCMGGRITFLTACTNGAVKAAVAFYGGGIGSVQPSERTPKAPLDYAPQLACPILLLFGEQDPFIPLDEVERIRKRLQELGKRAEVVVYPGAPHGFFCNERDSYRPEAAADAWERLKAFFATHLKGQG